MAKTHIAMVINTFLISLYISKNKQKPKYQCSQSRSSPSSNRGWETLDSWVFSCLLEAELWGGGGERRARDSGNDRLTRHEESHDVT